MNDNSFLVFETGTLGEVDQMYFKYFQRFQYPDHLFFFSTDNLVELLEKTGFELIRIYRYSILPQLKLIKAVSGLNRSIQKHISISNEKEQPSPDDDIVDIKSVANSHGQSFNAKSFAKESIRNTYQYFNYVLRYKIGRIVPKAHRPQTVIVVAKKRK